MDRASYCVGIIERHKKLMDRIDKESPPLTMRGRLVSQDGGGASLGSIFAISTTSRSVKLAGLIEQRVFIEEQSGVSGVVVDTYDDKLIIALHRKLPPSAFTLKIFANYNNEILLKAAASFMESDKEVHAALLQPTTGPGCRSPSYPADNASYSKSTGVGDTARAGPAPEDIQKDTAANERTCDGASPSLGAADEDAGRVALLNPGLNQSQRKAVFLAMQNTPFKILGPPGTGKTETIVEIIIQNLAAKKTVLVCGPSNISVDNIITRFSATRYCAEKGVKFYRLGSAWKGLVHLNLEFLADQATSFLNEEAAGLRAGKASGSKSACKEMGLLREDRAKRRREFIKSLKSETALVFATLFSSLKEAFYFDLCVVDEACQATELECFMGIVRARTFILVGDPNQLCPDSPSLYERAALPTVVLDRQYRMPGEIIQFSNEYFYKGSIASSRRDDFLFFGESKILFIDTSYFSYTETAEGTSKINEAEARLAAETASWLQREMSTAQGQAGTKDNVPGGARTGRLQHRHIPQAAACTIGVIAPYSAQVLLVRNLLETHCCSVDTVDGFQGQERDFIILSLVRSNAEGECGFLCDVKRMNVALTRCRRGLIVIGDSQNFQRNPFFRDLFRFLSKSAYVVDPELFRQLIAG